MHKSVSCKVKKKNPLPVLDETHIVGCEKWCPLFQYQRPFYSHVKTFQKYFLPPQYFIFAYKKDMLGYLHSDFQVFVEHLK